MSADTARPGTPVPPGEWTRDSRRRFINKLVDHMYAIGVDRDDIYEDLVVVDVYQLLPRYERDAYFQISTAYGEDTITPLVLVELFPGRPANMWDYFRRLAAASIVARMRKRAQSKHKPVDHTDWEFLGWVSTCDGFADLWGNPHQRLVQVKTGDTPGMTHKVDTESPDELTMWASRSLDTYFPAAA